VRPRVALASAAVLAALAVPAAWLSTTHAQERTRQPFTADPLSVSADIVEAMRLLNANPEAAVVLLHKLNTRYPNRDDILSRLGYALQVVDKPDSAAIYYRAALNANPLNLDAGKALGSILFTQGREREAMQVFDRMLDANNHGVSAYKMVAGALRDLGRPDEAIAVLEKGRERAKAGPAVQRGRSVGVLTLEIASYCKQMGDNRRALDEYFGYAAAETRNYRFVRDKMIELLRDAERDRETLIVYMRDRADRGGAGAFVAADVLAAHFLERGMLENSLEMALRADADKLADGASLLSLGEEATARAETKPHVERGRYYDLALRSLEAYTREHPKAASLAHARYLLAGVYAAYGSGVNAAVPAVEHAGYLERAVAEYAAVSRQYPGTEFAERAYVDRGDVLLRKLKRPQDALDAYKSGSVNARRDALTYAGRIAAVYIGTGRTAETEQYLRALSRAESPELAQAGQYYAGVYLATTKKYGAARDTLTSLAESAPFSPFANDAIETAWVIEEGLTLGEESLDDFAAAMKADLVGDTTTVVARLQTIVGRSLSDPLRPRALQRLGLLFFEARSYDAAIAVLRRFLDEYPDDDQCPAVQRAIGRTYEVGLGRYDAALKEYEHVLVAYSKYPMLDDVRRDVQRVRAVTQGATYAP
jgi:tetratricopeptide (TPR) repeat protein